MSRNYKYILDLSELQFKRFRLPFIVKFRRSILIFLLSIVLSVVYFYLFQNFFGSPKERALNQQLESMKLEYSLLERRMKNQVLTLNSLQESDDKRYRPVLDLDPLPESYREGAIGGVERYSDLRGYSSSAMVISLRTLLDEIKNRANVQRESFDELLKEAEESRRYLDHQPAISPVSVEFRLGDGYRFRPVHPVLGVGRMHYGQDFEVPYGTEVYATGDGIVVEAGNASGFGNYIVVDHEYGLSSLYGHLSKIKVTNGQSVKRGELIGISGNSGISTGPHLHYQIEERGHAINPNHYINKDMDLEEYKEMIQAFGNSSKYR